MVEPENDDNLFFVSSRGGDDTVTHANIAEAQTVAILGDDRLDPMARDAKVVRSTLTVESINRDVCTIVELVSDNNVIHCKRASASEIMGNNHVPSGLLARTALDHGITMVISEWLIVDQGDELFWIRTPTELLSQTFVEALTTLKRQYGCIVLGIQRKSDGEGLSNSPADYVLLESDQLIVASGERPNIT